jgi:hypothetical protein
MGRATSGAAGGWLDAGAADGVCMTSIGGGMVGVISGASSRAVRAGGGDAFSRVCARTFVPSAPRYQQCRWSLRLIR